MLVRRVGLVTIATVVFWGMFGVTLIEVTSGRAAAVWMQREGGLKLIDKERIQSHIDTHAHTLTLLTFVFHHHAKVTIRLTAKHTASFIGMHICVCVLVCVCECVTVTLTLMSEVVREYNIYKKSS